MTEPNKVIISGSRSIGVITVEGIEFPCLSCHGVEYGERGEGFPFEPYRMERLMGERAEFRGYLIDAKGIIWIMEQGVFERPCCRCCLDYVRQHDPGNWDKVFEVMEGAGEYDRH